MKCICFVSVIMIGALAGGDLCGAEKAPLGEDKWPEARTLVWSKPGTSDMALTAGNWMEYASETAYLAGKPARPAAKGPDANTDLVFPDAPDGKSYVAMFLKRSIKNSDNVWTKPPVLLCRHITIGKGAGLDGGTGTVRGREIFTSRPDLDEGVEIHGNVTVKEGGYIYGKLVFAGKKHTFFRIDNSPEPLASEITVRKDRTAGVTLLARRYDLGRGVTVESGRLTLGPGTRLRFNATYEARKALGKFNARYGLGTISRTKLPEGYVYVHKGAALQMQTGSSISRVLPPEDTVADVRIEGLLQIGSSGNAEGDPATIELLMGAGDGRFLSQSGGLYICPTAEEKNYGTLSITAFEPKGSARGDTGVSIFMESLADLGKVSIDYLRCGGIATKDPKAARAVLSRATFGKHCGGKGSELFSRLDLIDFAGGIGTVEFVDGLKTDCEILFPHAGRLIVRSKGNRTVQSFDLKTVGAVTVAGKRTEYSAKRELTSGEKELRNINALWGDAPGKGQLGKYGRYAWGKAPLLVWRYPGKSDERMVGPNWLDENGRPLFDSPLDLDPNIDILLPASDSSYATTGHGSGGCGRGVPCRHITIEYNAKYGNTFNIQGNLWMKHGGGSHGRNQGEYRNPGRGVHRFIRLDGKRWNGKDALKNGLDVQLARWATFETGKDSTLEFIGNSLAAGDWANVVGPGTLIMSEGSSMSGTNRSAFGISRESTVVLLQDARLGLECVRNQEVCRASVWVGGTLMIGMPDRPITRDMPIPVAGVAEDKINRSPGQSHRCSGVSFFLGEQGRLVTHSIDPAKARVVFKMFDSDRAKAKAREWGGWDTPEGIVLDFAGKTEFNGVVFDNVYEGGIMVSPEQRAKWKNVSYGKNNLAEPEKLYWDLKTDENK